MGKFTALDPLGDTGAVDAMNVIAPKVAAATALSTLPVLAATAPGIATAVGQRAGAPMVTPLF